MMIIKLFYVLHKIGMFHPSAIYRLGFGIFTYGINLMALLYFSSQNHKDRIAFIDEHETCTYDQLFVQSVRLATVLKNQYKLGTGKKTGILCKNHASLVKSIFAISSTGADIHFLHAEMSEKQLSDTLTQLDLDLLVYDEEYEAKLEQAAEVKAKLLSYHETLPSIHEICSSSLAIEHVPTRESSGKLVLQTGGTTGKPKEADHQPSLFHYLNPFEAFITRLHILQRHTAYIATPIYHGYGLAVMLLFLALGKK